MPDRLQGLELSRRFYHEAVGPILEQHRQDLSYAAAMIGSGSEVQGWDDLESTDHHWGPRVLLFVEEADAAEVEKLNGLLKRYLPHRFAGLSTSFSGPDTFGVRLPIDKDSGPVEHLIECTTVTAMLDKRLGVSSVECLTDEQWLSFMPQRLRELTGGEVFHDGPGTLTSMRQTLAWYPKRVWYELMAREWDVLEEEVAFVGRTGSAGDDRGSRVLAARQVRKLMCLLLLMERQYPPYSKWLGTAFARLPIAETLGPAMDRALTAGDWRTRQTELAEAYEITARRHNELGFTDPLETNTRPFYGRPYTVLDARRFAQTLRFVV